MSSAVLVFHQKLLLDSGGIVEMKLWQVPSPVRGSRHTFKYSLFFGKNGRRLIAYDNEAGKGDHRHYEDIELPYVFSTKEQLVNDFLADVQNWIDGEEGDDDD